MKKNFKRFIMSVTICFSLVFTLMMICSIIGLSIGWGNYLFALATSSIGFTLLYDINELKKILKRLIMSVSICFSLIFILMVSNAAMGLFIKFDFYLLLFGILNIGFTAGLVLFDSNIIFSSKKVKQPIKRKPVTNKIKKIESHSKVRRKIS